VNARIRGKNVRVDACLRDVIEKLNNTPIVSVGSCCGHFRYPQSILFRDYTDDKIHVFDTDIIIPRTRRFYRMDTKGYYFIPEMRDPKFLDSVIYNPRNRLK